MNPYYYFPDKWIVLKITKKETEKPIYKVFAIWFSSYTTGNSWRMNSGITAIAHKNNTYEFSGASGSKYYCKDNSYGTSNYGQQVLEDIIEKSRSLASITIMPEDTDWLKLKGLLAHDG